MKNLIIFSFLVSLLGCSLFEQKQMHLLVWETDYDKDGFKYLLYQYTMTDVDSGYLRKVILKDDKQFTFRHHSSPNQDHYKIFQNRYILSDYKIYDLELDSCISKNREEF